MPLYQQERCREGKSAPLLPAEVPRLTRDDKACKPGTRVRMSKLRRPSEDKVPKAPRSPRVDYLEGIALTDETLAASKISQNRKEHHYEYIGSVGKGSFGEAMLVRRKGSEELMVAKRMNIKGVREKVKERVRKEIEIMRRVRHKHIVPLLDYWQTPRAVYLILEHAPLGDLSVFVKYYRETGQMLSAGTLIGLAQQLAQALQCLHSLSIMHRDLKPANILMMTNYYLKLGDFGLSTVLQGSIPSFSYMKEDSHPELASSQVGTPYYQAPEVIQCKPYSIMCDMWSYGVVLYELMYLRYPFEGKDLRSLRKRVEECTVTHDADLLETIQKARDPSASMTTREREEAGVWAFVVDLIASCLKRDPAQRATSAAVAESIATVFPELTIPDYRETQ